VFVAILDELVVGWQPRDGVERSSVITLAQAQRGMMTGLPVRAARSAPAMRGVPGDRGESELAPARVRKAQVVEQAGAMVERFNRIFLQTLRTLSELRRHARMMSGVSPGGSMLRSM
jgi:hypothetical protein